MASYQGTNITPGTDQQVADQVAKIDASLATPASIASPATPSIASTVAPPVPATQPANTMSATNLGTQQPGTYSTYFPPATASVGLAETATASKDAYMARTAQEADQLNQDQDTGNSAISTLLAKLGGAATAKTDAEATAGLPQQQQDINDLTSTMESVSRNYDKQIQALSLNNPTGALAPGVAIETNRLNAEKASTLADYALVLNAKTRNYSTMSSIVDAKADAETEDLKTQLSGLEYFQSQNSSRLSDDQKTLLQDKIDAADKEYTDAKDARTAVGQVQLEAAKNGAPVSVIQAIGKAQDQASAISASGGYLKTPTTAITFSKADTQQGAANAGMPIDQFSKLSPDDQNYYINGYSQFQELLKQHEAGTLSDSDLSSAIDTASGISDTVKAQLKTKAGIDTASSGAAGWFSGAAGLLGSLLGV